jgi:hypothetical protein
MTREEAIDILRVINPPRESKRVFDEFMQARDMAIEALSAEPCEDAVSREAVKHALCKAVHKNEDIPCENQTASCLWSKTRVCDYAREIDALPSAQPRMLTETERLICKMYLDDKDKYKSCNEYKILQGLLDGDIAPIEPSVQLKPRSFSCGQENDAISRQAAIDECNKRGAEHIGYAIAHLPSAQPFYNITMNDVLKYIDGMPEDVWQEFTACLECRGWELQRRTAKWCGGEFA